MRRTTLRWSLFALLLAGAVAAVRLMPVQRWVLALVAAVQDAGLAGASLYVAVYVVATVCLLPGSLLTLAAGFIYGPVYGTPVALVAANLGATAAFLLARSTLREQVQRRLEKQPRFAALDALVGEHGFRVVALLRLSPLFPFTLLNYALGLTRVSLRAYFVASLLGMLPGTFLYVYLGSLVPSAAALVSGQRPEGGAAGQALFWGGLAATAAVTLVITRLARRALARAAPPPGATPGALPP
jgi:uncharacterized membrane protein YdjX (TVP38/TMEM64 family)